MTVPLLVTAFALLVGLLAMWLLGGGRATVAAADSGPVLAAAEIVHLSHTLSSALHLPAATVPMIVLFAVGLAVAEAFFGAVAAVVAACLVLAWLLETIVHDGADAVVRLVVMIAVIWLVIRFTRLLRP